MAVARVAGQVTVARGEVLDQIIDARYGLGDLGLEHHAFHRWHLARAQTAWGRTCLRAVALLDGDGRLLASATRYALTGVLDRRAIRVVGIGSVLSHSPDGNRAPAHTLVEQLLSEAAASGTEVALLFSPLDDLWQQEHRFTSITPELVEISLPPTRRPGAAMMLVRGGEDRDLAAIAAMGQVRSAPFGFHLDRDADFIHHTIAARRLLAGFGATGARELHFFIAEEGITAAAYVVVSVAGRVWTIQECGDRDPSGARLGALLQSLVAREPGSDAPMIRGWLPAGFVPPQATTAPSAAAAPRVFARLLGAEHGDRRLTAAEALFWLNDVF